MVRGCGMEFTPVEVVKILPESGPRGWLFKAGVLFPHFLALGLVLAEVMVLRKNETAAFRLLAGFALAEAALLVGAGVVLPLAGASDVRGVAETLRVSTAFERAGMAFALGYPLAGAVWIAFGRGGGGGAERLRRLGVLAVGGVLLWYGAFIAEGALDSSGRVTAAGLDFLRWGFWLSFSAALVVWVSLLER